MNSCGMLEQFIRLSVCCPAPYGDVVLGCYDEILNHSSLVRKRFAEYCPCGKAAVEIILGTSSLKQHPYASKLQLIMSFSRFLKAQEEDAPSAFKGGYYMCKNCKKVDQQSLQYQASLKKCTICKCTFYCSK